MCPIAMPLVQRFEEGRIEALDIAEALGDRQRIRSDKTIKVYQLLVALRPQNSQRGHLIGNPLLVIRLLFSQCFDKWHRVRRFALHEQADDQVAFGQRIVRQRLKAFSGDHLCISWLVHINIRSCGYRP